MELMSGLDKYGLSPSELNGLYDNNNQTNVVKSEMTQTKKVEEEKDFLFAKDVTCQVCDKKFKSLTVKSSKVRILGSDSDLRPIYKTIDAIKYGVISCPFCGYSALNTEFGHLSSVQIRLLKEQVASKFKSNGENNNEIYTYDMAIERYKLAIYSSIVKHASTSEKAYVCLKLAWLYRGKAEQLLKEKIQGQEATLNELKKFETNYYKQALEGFTQAFETEAFPICGMDMDTIDLLLAQMNYRLGHYDVASKLVSRILVSRTASRKAKDRALELKTEIIDIIKAGN